METYILNDTESKTLLEMADNCIVRGLISKNYELGKIEEVINYIYANFKQGLEVEMEIRVKKNCK